ncbi:ankyrin repeat domain-containing protein [Aquincola tertiaricarbonis]|uniref:ankyrin repeat domain-containing protein n=1 Tax=Aquincola tertiaricarbonis TaxID=391953 RepID=UPI000614AD72|nr:ankyrin repeat domain-containing protein [Aquincola tertiaricarbonis]
MKRRLLILRAGGMAALALPALAVRAGSYEDFFRAIDIDAPGIIRDLLARGFDPNARNPKGHVALSIALREQALKAAEALWAHPELDVNAENAVGETPLMMAAMRGEIEWARRLIQRGARVNKPGWSPMHYAAIAPDQRMMQFMLAQGGEVGALSPNGTTPLMMAARNGDERTVDLLLARGADARLKNQAGYTAADMARSQDRDNLADRLQALLR